jgi:hypothetical protein
MKHTEGFDPINTSRAKTMLLAGLLASSLIVCPVFSQSAASTPAAPIPYRTGPPVTPGQAASPAPPVASSRYRPDRFAGRAGRYYALFWGIEAPVVKAAEAGELIRFSYSVLDPEKAKTLNEKKNDAYLVFPDAKIRLTVPSLEKVGQLRQSSAPIAGRSYWMAFSNPGRRVKRGDHVNVVIGSFHAENLVVD